MKAGGKTMNEMNRCVELANEMNAIIHANTEAARQIKAGHEGAISRIMEKLRTAKQDRDGIKRFFSFGKLFRAKVNKITAEEARDMAQKYEQYAATADTIVKSEEELADTKELLKEADASLQRREMIEQRAKDLLEALTMPE